MILDFGKYKGANAKHVPVEYMIFLAGYKLVGTRREKCDLEACKWVLVNRRHVHEYAKNYLACRCWHCGRKLVPIGTSRKNGAAHHDWDGRYLHKTCWRKRNEEQEEESEPDDDDT